MPLANSRRVRVSKGARSVELDQDWKGKELHKNERIKN